MKILVTLERWKLVSAIVAALILGLAAGFLIEHARASSKSVATTGTSTPAPASASPTLLPTPTTSASATPSPTPTPAPAPSATPAPTLAPDPSVGNGSKAASQKGSGNQTTTINAILNNNWGFSYSFLCDGGGQFNVTIRDMNGNPISGDPPFSVQGVQAQGVQQFAQGGERIQVQITVSGSCQWSYDVYTS